MDRRRLDGKQSLKEVTEVISRNINAGHERDYDDWLRRFMISEAVSGLPWNNSNLPWRQRVKNGSKSKQE